ISLTSFLCCSSRDRERHSFFSPSRVYPTISVNMIAASLRRFWDDTFLRFLLSFLADKSVTKMLLPNYLECEPESSFFRLHLRLKANLTFFSPAGQATVRCLPAQ